VDHFESVFDVKPATQAKSGGWLVEIQIIPEEMKALKDSLGHTDYTQFRFILEAANRSRLSTGSK
jgi:hypothetical protein